MNSDTWEHGDDANAMWAYLPQPISSRKGRLWLVECCRRVQNPPERTQRYEQYAPWLGSPQWGATIQAAEEYADRRIDRSTLYQRRDLTSGGGPFNIFVIVAGHKRFTPVAAIRSATMCGQEFGAPTLREMCDLIRDIFGNPFRPVAFDSSWRTSTTVGLADAMYEAREFGTMPILADALEEAGCDHPDVLAHCRGDGPHVRGCWVVDGLLGKV